MHLKASIPDMVAGFTAAAGAALLLSSIRRRKRRISFRGASVVITGGSRGLGLEMARIFAREGARLTLLARDRAELERARRELIGLGGYVIVHECDIRSREDVEQTVQLIKRERGRIDVLVNNAGTIEVGPFENMTLRDFDEQLDVFARAPFYLTKAVFPVMRLQGTGRIVNISSVGGVVAIPHLVAYSTAKFALTGFSDGTRAELARHGILVTTVVPWLMRTGAHVNALYKGRHQKEYAWFAALYGIPLFSLNAERAARRIVEACRYGQSSVTAGVPAALFRAMNALLPGITAAVARTAVRLLPAPADSEGYRTRTGWESRPGPAPSFLLQAADQPIGRNNQAVGAAAGAAGKR